MTRTAHISIAVLSYFAAKLMSRKRNLTLAESFQNECLFPYVRSEDWLLNIFFLIVCTVCKSEDKSYFKACTLCTRA